MPTTLGRRLIGASRVPDLGSRHANDAAIAEIHKVARLKSRTLFLNNLGLTGLPPEIAQLPWLDSLEISSNNLTRLPTEIQALTKLDALYAGGNEITSLSDEIGALRNLRWLNLAGNRLTKLPDQIGNLANLKGLILTENQLHSLPSSIGRLTKLETLDLGGNQLRTVPPELADISSSLTIIELERNPLDEPLPSMLASGANALFSYLRSLEGGRGKEQYEAKVLLVGEGEVGKSSLVAALQGRPFIENRPTTHGIEIGKLLLPHPVKQTDITLNTWDFGGQEVYRITHQFFFSRRCLYVIVWNPRQGQEANEVEGWIKRIILRVGEEARIIIVATHRDIRNPELDFPYLKMKYGAILLDHNEVDSKSNRGIADLKQGLAAHASNLPQMGELLNPNWVATRKEILATPTPQVDFELFRQAGLRNDLMDDEVQTLAGLLHDLGHIIHYGDDEGLKDIVVLQPEWLTKAIGYVLEDNPTREAGGILDHRRLKEVWQGREPRYAPEYYPYFLRLMEKFDISYRLPDGDRSLIGQLVPYKRPILPWDSASKGESDVRQLSLMCLMEQEAPGLIAWLTVRNNRFSTSRNWRRGVFFEHPKYASQAMFQLIDDTTLTLAVRAPSPDYFFSILRDSLEDLISRRWPGLNYSLHVPCATRGCVGRFAFRTLQRFRENGRDRIDCSECLESFNVSELLTGFGPSQTPLESVLDEIRASRGEVTSGLRRLEVYAAQTADQVRIVLNAIAEEVTDCPRLFTFMPSVGRMARLKFWESPMTLMLWCEHSDHEHPWPAATYSFAKNKQWFTELLPYASLILKTLNLMVPIALDVAGRFIDMDEAELVRMHLDAMGDLFVQLPTQMSASSAEDIQLGQVSRAEGAGLRVFRSLLYELDPTRKWGGLRRRLTPSGDYVWVCDRHYHLYDPGLPVLPS